MKVNNILALLEQKMQVAIIASVDADGKPHNRPINIGAANENGIFFMTNPKTNFYHQLEGNPNIAITGLSQEENAIHVIRIEGQIKSIGQEKLSEVLADNPFVEKVYPDKKDRDNVQVFQLYIGKGFYQELNQGEKYIFEI